jgi:hypothetical protein
MSIAGSSSICPWKTSRSKVDLHELAPVVGRPAGGRDRGRFERFAEVREDFPDRPRIGDERNQPDVAATRWALERKLFPDPRHQFRPRNPGGVVRAGLFMSVAAAFRGMSAVRVPAGRGIT